MHPLAEGVLRGDVRSLARLLRAIDDRAGSWREALAELYPHTGKAQVVGITGNPGAGKSTLTDKLIAHHRAAQRRVGVVAVDPTSPFSGGAILGDRIRMQRHALDPGVFIRSLATRGNLGGLSRSTADSVHALDAWGADVVLVETVGVGQDELDIARLAHTTVVVAAPGMGDEIQAIKAGILEVADVFAVNKADRDGADATVRDLEAMLALSHEVFHAALAGGGRHHGAGRIKLADARAATAAEEWLPPIVRTVAAKGEGIEALCEAIEKHRAHLAGTEVGARKRAARLRDEVLTILRAEVLEQLTEECGEELDAEVQKLSRGEGDPYAAVARVVARFRGAMDLTPPPPLSLSGEGGVGQKGA